MTGRRLLGAEGAAGVAVGDFGEEFERIVVDGGFVFAQAADFVGERTADDRFDFVDREG